MQVDAFGPNDQRCFVTSNKITMLQQQVDGDGETQIKLEDALNSIPTVEEKGEKRKKGKLRFMTRRKKN